MTILVSLVCGLVFGLGLILAGMANPAKVLAFLDVTGVWDPSLAFVMGGAIAVALGPFAWARRQTRAMSGATMLLPALRRPDRRMLVGSALFGVGWGLAGICPGPALVLMGAGNTSGLIFGAAMVAGMALFAVPPVTAWPRGAYRRPAPR